MKRWLRRTPATLMYASLVTPFLIGAPRAEAESPPESPARERNERILERMQEERDAQAVKRAEWQKRYREAIEAERQAEARVEAAQAAWTRGRRNNRLRGEPRIKADRELREAKKALAEARSELAKIPEEARREGVPPGWLRDARSEASPPAAP